MSNLVVNKYKEKFDVYIGRGSIFGNPWKITQNLSREEVIEAYKAYFYRRIAKDSKFKEEVLKLKGKVLGCFCSPLDCHGRIIAEYLSTL